MDEFNYLFSLFSLLLGFSMAELVGGLGKAYRSSDMIRVGWLTPLLALGVAIDLASFWLTLWDLRLVIHPHMLAVLVGLAFCGGYYFISIQAIPDDHVRWPDFDAFYFARKRRVLFGIILINLAIFAMQGIVLGGKGVWTAPYVVANSLYLILLAAIAFVRGYRASLALLALNIIAFAASATYGALARATAA
ncbi:MAG: hypothetical protein V4530_12505 [Pseudomonadota bacterium]